MTAKGRMMDSPDKQTVCFTSDALLAASEAQNETRAATNGIPVMLKKPLKTPPAGMLRRIPAENDELRAQSQLPCRFYL